MTSLKYYKPSNYRNLIYTNDMPKSRKRHHSRSRSRSHSREREDKYKRNDSHEKDRDGKRRKIDSYDSPPSKRSVSEEPEATQIEQKIHTDELPQTHTSPDKVEKISEKGNKDLASTNNYELQNFDTSSNSDEQGGNSDKTATDEIEINLNNDNSVIIESGVNKSITENSSEENNEKKEDCINDNEYPVEPMNVSEINHGDDDATEMPKNDKKNFKEKIEPSTNGSTLDKKKDLNITPNKVLSPKQMQRKLESEKKRLDRQKEREERERKKNEEKERLHREKQKKLEEKRKELELKQKEKEMKEEQRQKEKQMKEEQKQKEKQQKEEQKRKEKEEKELKRKEKEEREEAKRQEKLKKQEKEMEKQKEEEKKQKAAAAFVNFFVSKKSEIQSEDSKNEDLQTSMFMAFEIKSDMKLPPPRRKPMTEEEMVILDNHIKNQHVSISYLKDLQSGKPIGTSSKTWSFEEEADDIEIVEDSGNVGNTICEEIKPQKLRAKFFKFHENRRPPYFGTWRKRSMFIKPRRPLAEDKETFNYEEDSDDDWEEEEQGESLNGSDDEADKENDDEKDDYEVDNEFFVPHGHLSDDEVDDEENKRMSPESMKQKLKLLKDEFDLDMQSKTNKLKPKAIGCIWYNKNGNNVDEAIHKYLQPLAIICRGQIEIKRRSDILCFNKIPKVKFLDPDIMPIFLKYIHGSEDRKKQIYEKFKMHLIENGVRKEFTKQSLLKYLKQIATKKKSESGKNKNKMVWVVNPETREKYNLEPIASSVSEKQ